MARRSLGATCTHTTMTRIYSVDLRCDSCHQLGAFGWLYRCTQDREELIRQMLAVGSKRATFDEIGDELAAQVKPRLRGPEARADKLSFFDEITPEQLRTYSAEQVATILRQREHVKKVIQEELAKHREDRAEKARLVESRDKTDEHALPETARIDRWDELQKTKPWVPRPEDECQFKVCPTCRETGAERACISLNGVLNGDIPATAATGYGFHIFDRRPVYDAAFVAKLGQHASHVVSAI
ncbi:hypothetical protein ACRALDRAFT_2093999 [Sodiomyces alcalophilus JCM 7366]|uniref:uncharacterized protein n=1 Tax=Sodiomyces alcalophilus JCM 7366 TaxID=591952 RepID=UPI0039B6D8D6